VTTTASAGASASSSTDAAPSAATPVITTVTIGQPRQRPVLAAKHSGTVKVHGRKAQLR
jgi:hypothetical protein